MDIMYIKSLLDNTHGGLGIDSPTMIKKIYWLLMFEGGRRRRPKKKFFRDPPGGLQ